MLYRYGFPWYVKDTTKYDRTREKGIVGTTDKALKEGETAVKYGYDLALVSMGGLQNYSEDDLITHTEEISKKSRRGAESN